MTTYQQVALRGVDGEYGVSHVDPSHSDADELTSGPTDLHPHSEGRTLEGSSARLEQQTDNLQVAGSTPAPPTTIRCVQNGIVDTKKHDNPAPRYRYSWLEVR